MSRKSILAGVVALLAITGLLVLWLLPRDRGRGAAPASAAPVTADRSASVLQTPPGEQLPTPGDAREVAEIEVPQPGPAAEEARAIQLLVVSQGDERPIAGARVTAYEDAPDGRAEREISPGSETGTDGRCAVYVSLSGPPVRLKVEREGFFHQNAYYERREELTVQLAPTSTLAGRVLAADTGAPVPGARIRLPHNYCKKCEPDLAIADAQGNYELPGVPRHQSTPFQLEAEGFPFQYRMFEIREEDATIRVDFRLERGFEIAGRVVDFTSGVGLPGARVGEVIRTDPSGAFHGRVLREEGESAIQLRVEAEGHSMLLATLGQDPGSDLFEFRLPRGAIVEGTVKDDRGAPIPSASVRLHPDHLAQARARARGEMGADPSPLGLPNGWRLEPEGYHCVASTDEHGTFRIENAVPWSTWMLLSVVAEGYPQVTQKIERVRGPGESTWQEIVVETAQPEVSISGNIRLNGQPLRTAKGRVLWKGPSRAEDAMVHNGMFYTAVEPGDVVLTLELEGLPQETEGTQFTLHIEQGKKVDHVVDFSLPTRPVSGRVTFSDGGVAHLASIDASFPLVGSGKGYWDRAHTSAKTAEDGSYTLDVPDLSAPYRVVASLDADEQVVEGVHAGARNVDFVLVRSGVLLFRFHDSLTNEQLPGHDFELGWKQPGEEKYGSLHIGWDLAPDPDGWFEKRLPAGRMDLRAREYEQPRHVAAIEENVLIRPDEPLRVEFEMLPGKSVECVLGPEEAPLPGRHSVLLLESHLWESVRLSPDGSSWEGAELGNSIFSRIVQFNQDRRATISGLGTGRFRFKVFPDDIELEPAEVEVGEKPSEPVILRWRKR